MITIRPAKPSEHVYIRDTWARSFGPRKFPGWAGDPFFAVRNGFASVTSGQLSPRWWFAMHRAAIDMLLGGHARTPSAHALVAVHSDIPDEILGWLAYSSDGPLTLHYAYVRKDARRKGLAAKLCAHIGVSEADEVRCSHMTPDGEALLASVFGKEAAA